MKTRNAVREAGRRHPHGHDISARADTGRTSPAVPRAGSVAFFSGFAALAFLWLGPLPAMSQTAFSPAMLLHLGVVALAAPLIAFGLAGAAIRPGFRAPSMFWPVGASLFEALLVWGWHVPAAHEAAARSQAFFAAQQLSYLAAGLAVWFFALAGRGRQAAAGGVLACFLSFMHMTVLGMLFLLLPVSLYDPALCRGAYGLSPLDDQRLGGMLMIGWGGLAFLAGGLIRAWPLVSGADGR
ncbi:MAG: cytochrome c oxidase assembly protein [bacterium]